MAAAMYMNRCNFTSACGTENFKNCGVIGDSLSANVLGYALKCAETAGCGPMDFTTCLAADLLVTSPVVTSPQAQVATGYCQSCDPTDPACETSFFALAATPPPPGYFVYISSDTFAERFKNCLGKCKGDFLNCTAVIYCQLNGGVPRDACKATCP
jgi:hypothetical protein